MPYPTTTPDPSSFTTLPSEPATEFVAGLGRTVRGFNIPIYDRLVGNYTAAFVAAGNYPDGVQAAADQAVIDNRIAANVGSAGVEPPAA